MARAINPLLKQYILLNVEANPSTIGQLTAAKFNVSRTTVSNYLRRLEKERFLTSEGKTNAKKYFLRDLVSVLDIVPVTPDMEDDEIWRSKIRPAMVDIAPNVVEICHHGFTEMFNNVIDHSESKTCTFWYRQDINNIQMGICDAGVGIFNKIQKDFGLHDKRQALLELSKGKLTSDPSKHTGEGIFFTSRMFDRFSITSYDFAYVKFRVDDDWMIEVQKPEDQTAGTCVIMRIRVTATHTAKDVFDKYMDDDLRFAKTHVPLTLARHGDEQLVSRSQARRLLARVENFSEVLFDFSGVTSIGQAFADEIFRVYQREHPAIKIIAISTSPDVDRMIAHAKANASEEPLLPFAFPEL